MDQGRRGRLLVGFVALHVLCCELPLLLGAGVLGGAGALLGSPLLLATAVLALVVAAVGLRARRRGKAYCSPTELPPPAGATGLAQPRPEPVGVEPEAVPGPDAAASRFVDTRRKRTGQPRCPGRVTPWPLQLQTHGR